MADIFDLFKRIEKKEDSPKQAITWLIVGLGNPGDKYKLTRHNAGFLTMDYLAEQYGVRIDRAKYHALCGEATIGGHRILLMKPQTFMNHSGLAVQEAASFYKISLDHILVISDDISQAPGKMRLRRKGSAGGQKGLNDIITCMGSDAFPRMRMGVGEKPHPDYDLAAWVLSEFSKEEQALLFDAFGCVSNGLRLLLDGKFEEAQQLCNSHDPQTQGKE